MIEQQTISGVEEMELKLRLEAVYIKYGYDFRNYAQASIKRRVLHTLQSFGIGTIPELTHAVLADKKMFENLLLNCTINVTEMFRDPTAYHTARKEIIPYLRTYPHLKIWHAGCASGEEVYSMAILLKEEGLYDRTQIYGTDINEIVLKAAREGIYSIEQVQEFTKNYQKAGGREPFSNYYKAKHDYVIMDKSLKTNVLFTDHNLVTDSIFGEMHMIVCRNLLIYFDRELQNKVFKLFLDSLCPKGYLWIGKKESIHFSEVRDAFETVDAREKIYRKVS